MEPALSESLMEAVLASGNVREAWQRVKSNGGSAGIDGTAVDEFIDKKERTCISEGVVV